jgi:nitrate/nitrite transport system substrate-binding protein
MSSTGDRSNDGIPPCPAACTCGKHGDQAQRDEDLDVFAAEGDEAIRRPVESAVLRALFPNSLERRALLQTAGATAVLAAVAQFFPLATATEAFADTGPIEKADLKVGFLASTCATPIILAGPMGLYGKNRLKVNTVKTPGWDIVRDRVLSQEYDASHMLAPMPLAMALGLGCPPAPIAVPMLENVNAQSIVLAMRHKDMRDPSLWKGFKFAISFEYSMHNYLLRYYLADLGYDPDHHIELKFMPSREMISSLATGKIDAFFAQDNLAQRAVRDNVGFIHMLSKEIWSGHPCCAIGADPRLLAARPNTYRALFKSIIEANIYARKPSNHRQVAEFISPPEYLDQPVEVIEAVLSGSFADGLGNSRIVPDRIRFDAFPWESFAMWILTQMKRWGQIKGNVDYATVAQRVFLATDAKRLMADAGLTPPASTTKNFAVMGKEFNPAKPAEYLAGFSIKRTA